jgi:hypothetical protein
MIAAGTTGLIAATAAGPPRAAARGRPEAADGTPEQVHLTWGDDPTRTVVVSWASPGQAERPRVRIGQRVIAAAERVHPDPLNGTVSWTYHARVDGLRPGATYGYAVTADNDANAADPFSATFTTAPEGRAAFRFTSFGDLAAANQVLARSRRIPDAAAQGDNWQAAYAVGAVETFQPLFHLLNGDLTYAELDPDAAPHPAARARAWRDFGNNVQASAANRPWLPVPGSHELEPGNGEQALAAYLTRYMLPSNGTAGLDGFEGLEGRWYAFRVGTAIFVCLSGDDAAFSAAGAAAGAFPGGAAVAGGFSGGAALAGGPAPPPQEPSAGSAPTGSVPANGALGAAGALVADGAAAAGTSRGVRGYSGGAQTRWLESTLAAARADASIDWIVVQLHQCACSSAPGGNGSDLGVRQEWLPLFDTYEVDLVLSGHDYGYERSFPVRGFDSGAGTDKVTRVAVDTRRPRPVTMVDSGVFDTSQGTVHLVLGCGGAADPVAAAGGGPGAALRTAPVFTRPAAPVPDQRVPGRYIRPAADAVEPATWSARRDTSAGYGIAVFDVSPGSEAGGQTSITVRYYHAAGPDPTDTDAASPVAGPPGAPDGDYTLFDTFTLVRPRSDGRRWHPKGLRSPSSATVTFAPIEVDGSGETSGAVAEVGGSPRLVRDRVEDRGAADARRGLGKEADAGAGGLAEREVAQQLPVGAVRRGVERPGPPRPGDAEPKRAARGLEGVAVVGRAAGDHGDGGRLTLRGELVAELGPAPLAEVQQQDAGVKGAGEAHGDPGREREVVLAGQAGPPARVGARGLIACRVDEQVGLGSAHQGQRPAVHAGLAGGRTGGREGERHTRQAQIGHGRKSPTSGPPVSSPTRFRVATASARRTRCRPGRRARPS